MMHEEIRKLSKTISDTFSKSSPEEFKAHITAKNTLHALLMNSADMLADVLERDSNNTKVVDPWREQVIGELCLWHCLPDNCVNDPVAAVQLLLSLNTQGALDPKISEEADALLNRGRLEGAKAMKNETMTVILREERKPLNNRGAAYLDISKIDANEVVNNLKEKVAS